ncbi:MAG: hypothetical protein P8R42_25980 [Candidatus Binatia bacterium]|nr:hypothetical protein [Candidatus Binatia bacterium]
MRKPSILALSICALALPSLALAAPLIYVTNQGTNTVHVLQSTDGLQVASIPVGQAPTGIAIDSNGTFAYVANRGDNTVSRIDIATNTVTATIPVPGNPTAVALTPDGATAYVVQSTECVIPGPSPTPTPGPSPTPGPTPEPTPEPVPVCMVAAIDSASDTVIANIEVGNGPFDVALSPSGGFAYVTNRADDSVSVIDTSTNLVIDEIPVGATPEGIAAGGGEIYVSNDSANTVTVIRELDLQIVGTVLVGAGPLGVAVSPDGLTGVVSNDQDGSVTIFETGIQFVTGSVPVGSNPAGIAVFPDSTKAAVANTTDGSVSIFGLDGSPGVTVSVFGSPAEVAISPEPNVTLSKTASPLPAAAGGTVTFSLVYANIGTGPATTVVMTDPVPTHLTFVSATGGGALSGSDVVWNIGTIPAGGSGSVTATFSVASPLPTGTITTNTATLEEASIGQQVSASLQVNIESNPVYGVVASAPNPFVAAGQATYTITYSNLGTADSVSTLLIADYPNALSFFDATPPPETGTDNQWSIGSLPPGAGGTITVTVDVGSPLANGSTISTLFTMTDVFSNDTVATATNTVQSAPQLTLAITDVPDPAPADGIVLYDAVFTNPGTDTAFNVVLNLGYDPLLTYVGADVTPDTALGDTWTIPQIRGGDSSRVRIQVQLPSVVPNGTLLTSSATVTDDLGNTASASVDTTAQSSPSLSLVASDSPDPVITGGQITYLLTYSNTGSDTATGVVVSATYSAEIAFFSSAPTPDVGTDNVFTIGSLAPGASATIAIVADAIAPNGSIATLTGIMSDALSNSSTATVSTVIDLIPALQLGIVGAPEPVQPGNILTYALNYGNSGTLDATGTVLSAALPAGVIFVSATPAPDFATTDTWTLGTLAVGASGTVTLRGLVDGGLPDGTLLLSNATLQDDSAQLITESTTNTVQTVEGIALAAAASIDPVAPGGQVMYTISYGNPGDTTLIDAMMTVVYDADLSFVGSVPPPASASNDFWFLGDIPPGGGGSIQVTVAVGGGVQNGAILGTEAALSAAGGENASVALLSSVETAPGLSLALSSAQTEAKPAGLIDLTIDYANDGVASVDNVVVTFDAGAFFEILGTVPPPTVEGVLSWDIGTLTPGQSGAIQVQVMSGAPSGSIASFSAIATGTGTARAASLHLPAAGAVEWEEIKSGRWQKKPTGKKGGSGRIKIQGRVLVPPTFDGTGAITVTVSSPTKILASFYMPAGTMIAKGSGFRVKKAPNLLPTGGEVSLNLSRKGGTASWKLRIKASHQELPLVDSNDLRVSVDLGEVAVSSVRTFQPKGPVTPTFQQLRYSGD